MKTKLFLLNLLVICCLALSFAAMPSSADGPTPGGAATQQETGATLGDVTPEGSPQIDGTQLLKLEPPIGEPAKNQSDETVLKDVTPVGTPAKSEDEFILRDATPVGVPVNDDGRSAKGKLVTSEALDSLAGTVYVTSAWTTDSNGSGKTTFNRGDGIRYYGAIANSTGGAATAYFQWIVNGPCGSIASWAGNLNTGSGTWYWNLGSSIPSNACGGSYTFELRVTYNGQTSTKSASFTVNGSGAWKLPFAGIWTFSGGPHIFGRWPGSCNDMIAGTPSGMDFAADSEKEILAVDAGTVVRSGWNLDGFNGYDVEIQHGDYVIGYYHMKGDTTWSPNQTVLQGTVVGKTHATNSYHVHLELKRDGQRVSWDSMTIDGYVVHTIRRASDPSQVWNYEGTLTKGNTWTENRASCGSWGTATYTVASQTWYHWNSVTSSNQRR